MSDRYVYQIRARDDGIPSAETRAKLTEANRRRWAAYRLAKLALNDNQIAALAA